MAEPKIVCQVEYYHDLMAESPSAWDAARRRINRLSQDDLLQWATVGVDSMTGARLAAYYEQQYVINPIGDGLQGKDIGIAEEKVQMRWNAGATTQLERYFVGAGLARSPRNVVLTAHIEEERMSLATKNQASKKLGVVEYHDRIVRRIAVPGRLASRGELPSQYGEVYRQFIKVSAGNEPQYLLQTKPGSNLDFMTCTQIEPPNPCEPDYKALWENWKYDKKPPLHCLVYGNFGAGKTRFMASWPKPLLVMFFDSYGKDLWFMQLFNKLKRVEGETEEGMPCVQYIKE